MRYATILLCLLTWGCGTGEMSNGDYVFAIAAYDFKVGEKAGFGDDLFPGVVLGPPSSEGEESGSTDVLSLGVGGQLTLQFVGPVYDGEGVDFIVYENPFRYGDRVFSEPAQIAVSSNGTDWIEFPCAPENPAPNGCAGYEPVLQCAGETDQSLSARAECGGDQFDLDTIGVEHFEFVRITDRSLSAPSGNTGGFDLDAVAGVYFE